MPGLVPGIHALNRKFVDGRVKPGHDGVVFAPQERDELVRNTRQIAARR
jgi:hypothetical protein